MSLKRLSDSSYYISFLPARGLVRFSVEGLIVDIFEAELLRIKGAHLASFLSW